MADLAEVIRREKVEGSIIEDVSPRQLEAGNDHEPPLPLEEALVLLRQAEEERRAADQELDDVLTELGFAGWRSGE